MKAISIKEWFVFALIYLFIYCIYIFFNPTIGFVGDMNCWIEWSDYSTRNGLQNIYNSSTDYLPLYHYILFAFGKLQSNIENIRPNIYLIKNVTIIFDLLIGFQLFRLKYLQSGNFIKSIIYSLFYVLNILVIYNSIIWGQVDSIFTSFVFLSIVFAYENKIIISVLMYVIAINFKLQAIVFLPLLGIMLLPNLCLKKYFIKYVKAFISAILLQIIILLPFILNHTFDKFLNVVFGSFAKYEVLSMNAFNLWHLFFYENLMIKSDKDILYYLSFKNWGLIFFLITAFISFFPLLKHTFLKIKYKTSSNFPFQKILIIGALIPLLFFYFNTEMHERYSHPAFPFLAALAILYKKPFVYIIASFAYFFNLEMVMRFLQLKNYLTVIFHPIFISILYLIVIIYLIINLYQSKNKNEFLNNTND